MQRSIYSQRLLFRLSKQINCFDKKSTINLALSPQFKEIKMIHLERTLEIDALPDDVWAVLGNFMHADEFGPELASIDALTKGKDRAGSKRRSNFTNGGSLVEEILEWEPQRRYHRIQLSEMSSMPIDDAYSRMYVEPTESGRSMVTWDFDFHMKYGPFGWLLGQTMMKMMMGKVIDGNLKGLAEKVKSN
jgi:hypothetical protein